MTADLSIWRKYKYPSRAPPRRTSRSPFFKTPIAKTLPTKSGKSPDNGLPSRRTVLAAAPIVALAASMRHAVAGENRLPGLIKRHRAAHKAFNEICGFDDRVEPTDSRYAGLCAEYARLDEAEEIALNDLCSYRPKTMREVRERSDYLVVFLRRNHFTDEQEKALFLSFAS